MVYFIKKYITSNMDCINRMYLGYTKRVWQRNGFYIDISDYPSIMVAGEHEDTLKQVLTLIGTNVNIRSFDSEIITEVYSEKSNVGNKYSTFKNIYNNKSIESLLLEIKQDVTQRLTEFKKLEVVNINKFNEKAKQPMKRRVVIIDGFEDVMDNIIVLGLYKDLTTRMRIAGITLLAVVNTDKLMQSKRSSLFSQLSKVQNQMIQHFPCKILTKTYEKIEKFPYDTQNLKDNQMIVEYGKYKRENGLLGELISDVLQIPKFQT